MPIWVCVKVAWSRRRADRGGRDAVGAVARRSPFVALTTFRRDGTPVATPVWVARSGAEMTAPDAAAEAALRTKYGWQYRLVTGIERLLTRGPRERVILRITTR